MARFFVGQRVRIVRVEISAEALGKEARVLRFTPDAISRGVRYAGYEVCVDGIGAVSPRGRQYCFREGYLEPILPSGHCAGDFSYRELMDKCREGRGVAA